MYTKNSVFVATIYFFRPTLKPDYSKDNKIITNKKTSKSSSRFVPFSGILRDKTTDIKLMNVHIVDKQNYLFCTLKLLIEKFGYL